MKRAATGVILLVLVGLALSLRLVQLGNRPFHGDEAVHAVKFQTLWEHGLYEYDPNEFHGPTIYYAALPFVIASGHHRFAQMQEADFRAAIAVLGAAMVPLLLLFRRALGLRAVLWAGLFLSVSPAFVFYSRYFIQEVFLVFFTLGFLSCLWRATELPRRKEAIGAGVFAGLMVATKETAVLSLGAAFLAALLSGYRPRVTRGEVLLFLGALVAVAYVVLSGFFRKPAGPLGYFATFTPWLHRAGQTTIHNHPWHYYLRLLAWQHPRSGLLWSEGLVLALALVGGVFAFRRGQPQARFLVFYSLVLTAVYSAIPYKTPWCALNFLAPLILLAGYGAASLLAVARPRALTAALTLTLLAGAVHLGWQAYQASFVYFADQKNPFVYAQTSGDVDELQAQVEELAEAHPQHRAMVIQVISKDGYYWPLPWTLRSFDRIGYWVGATPANPEAPVVLASPEFDEALTRQLDKTHLMTGYYSLRPGALYEMFVRLDLWEPFLKRRAARGVRPDDN